MNKKTLILIIISIAIVWASKTAAQYNPCTPGINCPNCAFFPGTDCLYVPECAAGFGCDDPPRGNCCCPDGSLPVFRCSKINVGGVFYERMCCTAGPGPGCTDLDGDGYGDPASPLCANPGLDCDDSDFAVNPGVAENCVNGIDDDCDGDVDGADSECGGPGPGPGPVAGEPTQLEKCELSHDFSNWAGLRCPVVPAGTTVDCNFTDPNQDCIICCAMGTVYTVTDWLFYGVVSIAIILVVLGAYKIMTAAGNSDKINSGRNYILWSMVGLGVALLAKSIPTIVKSLFRLD